jgi:Concanavalin A-like lectin/glucanases superfamily
MALYVNGALIGSRTYVGEMRLDAESLGRPLVIGAELNGPDIDDATGEFDGYVGDVRLYDSAFSDEEIRLSQRRRRLRSRFKQFYFVANQGGVRMRTCN